MTGLDTCIRKPLIATCGSDRSIRIWNYVDRSTDLCKVFSEECRSIAFHPSGLHVLCGFSDKLRLMNLLMDDIRPYKEFAIKGCPECRFSTGGHWFAAVNGNTIQIYSTYTCEAYGNLRGARRRRAFCRAIRRVRSPPLHPLHRPQREGAVDLVDGRRRAPGVGGDGRRRVRVAAQRLQARL